jgi:Ca2+-binding RTX toxin-like protein
VLWGNAGNDLLNGGTGTGADTLLGDAGTDVLEGMDGNDMLSDSGGNNLFNGGAGNDTMTGNSGNELFIGGAGNDTINTGSGADIIAFNRGDGQDTVVASTGTDNTINLGGGIRYSDLKFTKSGNNLVLGVGGSSEQVTLQNWYNGTTNKSVIDLQVIEEASADFDANSADPLLNRKIQRFDFQGLVNRFDQAGAPNAWALTNALLDMHLAGSDTDAIGGDLAYRYGLAGSLAGIALTPAQGIMADPGFGSAPQQLQPLQQLQNGLVKLS